MPSLSELIAWGTNPDVSRIIIALLIGYLVLLWVSLIIWTTKDIISRTNNVVYQLISILLVVILNIFGLFIYLGVRPAKTLIEKFFEDLEYEALAQATKIDPANDKKPKKRGRKPKAKSTKKEKTATKKKRVHKRSKKQTK
jgi:uncharacterized protein YacL